jgi:hypothetical protein
VRPRTEIRLSRAVRKQPAATPTPIGAHSWPRQADEWYVERPWVSRRLFDVEDFNRDLVLLDWMCGIGVTADAGKAAGYVVVTADVVNRGYPECRIQDFRERGSVPPSVVCNPPFPLAQETVRHALKLGARKVAIVFPVARLNAARWLQDLPLRRIWLLTPRPSMPPGEVILRGEKPGGGKVDFCWLVFEAGYVGRPELRWLHRDGDHA